MNEETFAPKPESPEGPWDVVIIGSGPSGLTAAIYTTRGALSTLVLGGEGWGGQLMLTTQVDNFPGFPKGILGPKLMGEIRAQAEKFGAEFQGKNVTGIEANKYPFEVKTDAGTYTARSIIIATGAETKWLDAPGISKLIGRGVSSCAPCDAPFFKGKKVAVVGGGDSAMEEALTLTKYATEVTIIHRRDEFRASAAMQEEVKQNPKIKIRWNAEVIEAKGDQKLDSLRLKDTKTGDESEIPFDGLFIAIGHVPSTGFLEEKNLPAGRQVQLDEKGYVVATEGYTKTSIPGIFVSGDVQDTVYKQAVTAAGFGCMAGMDVIKYLSEKK